MSSPPPADPERPPLRYVVHLNEGAGSTPGQKRQGLLADGEAEVTREGGQVLRLLPLQLALVSKLSSEQVARLERSPLVRKVEVDPPRFPLAETLPWGIAAVNAPSVWSTTSGKGAKVCVIDSGLYAPHADLSHVSLTGHPADWGADACGHGTHVAGTIAAAGNELGVVGVNREGADLHVVRVFGESCNWSYASELAEAVMQCQSAGARIVNLSLGGSGFSELEADAFESAARNGMLLVAAAGNDGTDGLQYPASYPPVVSVAAVTESNARAAFSQHNAQVDLAAPGLRVLSTVGTVSRHEVTAGDETYVGFALSGAPNTSGIEASLSDGGKCTAPNEALRDTIAICTRGENSFAQKAANVLASGGKGMVVVNDREGAFSGTYGEGGPALSAVGLTREDGERLRARLGTSTRLLSEPVQPGSGYAQFSGTSMATPHVAGVASLIWARHPSRTAAQVRFAMEVSALDLGPAGRDDEFGHGLVKADLALSALADAPSNLPPQAGFLAHCDGLTCELRDVSHDGDGRIASRAFVFPDGSQSDRLELSRKFDTAGPHRITLSVTDDRGATASTSAVVSALTMGATQLADGSGVELTWAGAAGEKVVILRDGQPLAETENSGKAQDLSEGAVDGAYRICTVGLTSCSAETRLSC